MQVLPVNPHANILHKLRIARRKSPVNFAENGKGMKHPKGG